MALHYDGEVKIKKLSLGPFDVNCYIVICPQTNQSVIIDTPAEAEKIIAEAEATDVKHILITHTHLDHLGAFQQVRDEVKAPVAIHPLEADNLPSSPDSLLKDGDTVRFGDISLHVLHTPGHTPGSLGFLTGRHLFSGDTIFPGGPGKTRSPAAFEEIVKTITQKIFTLPDDTFVYPGHGEDAVLGNEKREFEVFSQRPHDRNLCGDVLWLSP